MLGGTSAPRRPARPLALVLALAVAASMAALAGLGSPAVSAPSASRATSAVRVDWHQLTVRPGQTTRVSGEASPGVAGRPVLVQRSRGGAPWRTVATARTELRGAFAVAVTHPVRPGTFSYRVRVPATRATSPAISRPVRYVVSRGWVSVSAKLTAASVAVGESASLTGLAAPRGVVRTLEVQQRAVGQGWSLLRRVAVAANGSFSTALPTAVAGVTDYRAVVPRSSWFLGASSAALNLVVRPPVPLGRFLLGAAYGANTDPAPLEADAGVKVGIRRTYFTATQVAKAVTIAKADVALGRTPFVSFKLPYTWAEMAAGLGDTWARDAADQLATVNGTVLVSLHHEPEHDQPDIRDWTALQKRLAPFFDQAHLEFGITVTGWNQFYSGDPTLTLESLYPYGAPIDFVALDPYQWYGTPKNETKWTNLTDYYVRMQAFAETVDVEWGLAEFGISDAGFASPNGPTFFTDTVAQVKAHGGSFAAYFDTPLNNSGNSWPLTGAKRQAFLATLAVVQGTP